MSTPHKHAALIHAWADGAEIESRGLADRRPAGMNEWKSLTAPSWHADFEYRIKPHRWQAEIDAIKAGKAVQGRCIGHVAWWPVEAHVDFDSPELAFRVKPEMLRFRLYRQHRNEGPWVRVCNSEGHAQLLKSKPDATFGGWIGDWQEVEA